LKEGFDLLPVGKGETLRAGKDVAVLALGEMVNPSMKAAEILEAEGISCEVVNMRFVKPIDEELLLSIASRFSVVVTVEDNAAIGGFGGAVNEFFTVRGITSVRTLNHGIPDRFVEHGSPAELHAELQFDPRGIAAVIARHLGKS
jgi:1-deoxy-D-xylulose-5-phosphate synthase